MLSDVTIMSRQRFVSPVDFAVIHAGLGDADSVFQWLEVAFQTRATRIHELTRPISTRFVQILATQISDVVWVYPSKLRSPEGSYSQL